MKIYKSLTFMSYFKSVGRDVQVFKHALILKPEMIELGDGVRIDDYCRIEGGNGIKMGKYVHISSFSSIFGGGSADIGDYCAIAQGGRLLTGIQRLTGILTVGIPEELRHIHRGHTKMEIHSFIGTNAVVLPDIVIGRGAVVGAGAVVTKDVAPWKVVAGIPSKVIGERIPLIQSGHIAEWNK